MFLLFSGMWIPFKEILSTIEIGIVHRKSEVYADLDEILSKHRSVFVNLLKNPVGIFIQIHNKYKNLIYITKYLFNNKLSLRI